MPGKSQTHTDAVLNLLRGTTVNGISPFVGLFSAAPANDAGAGTELAGNGYQRQAATFGAPATDTGNVRKISNTSNISFGPSSSAWLQAVAFGIFDAETSGALLYWDVLPTPKTVEQDDYGQFAPGSLVVKED
ncbi:phage tail fiber protein [Paludibaculum fermentans]|uniref:Uncharacterized protein n=1 Tax=Paludibaculum fermentans TaxID=1473598 RepID=A0A7S7NR03_PALFE|nr:hypothetical protein [Paludibaculum fermentans]QOY88182.1 hypothetical protein IRI77_36515 [Paludibaculum fermentans]